MCAGTAFSARFTESRNRPHVPIAMMAEITTLMIGSSQNQPVAAIARPAITTPAETPASAAMCR